MLKKTFLLLVILFLLALFCPQYIAAAEPEKSKLEASGAEASNNLIIYFFSLGIVSLSLGAVLVAAAFASELKVKHRLQEEEKRCEKDLQDSVLSRPGEYQLWEDLDQLQAQIQELDDWKRKRNEEISREVLSHWTEFEKDKGARQKGKEKAREKINKNEQYVLRHLRELEDKLYRRIG
jgi:hypothetical protein